MRDSSPIPGLGRSLGGGHGNSLQCSCLENPMDRGAWRATVHGATKSQTRLKWLSAHAHWPWIDWIFSGAIPGSVLKTNIFMAHIGIQRRPLIALRWASKQMQFPQYLNSCSLLFSWTLGSEGRSVSPGSKFPPSLHFEALQVLCRIYFKASSFPVKAFCICKYSVSTSTWLLISGCSSWNCVSLQPNSFWNGGGFTEIAVCPNPCLIFRASSIRTRATLRMPKSLSGSCCLIAVMSNSLPHHGLQHARLPCPSLSPRVCTDLLSQWCYLSYLLPLLLLPSIFPSIRIFSSESALGIRWPKYWASASVLPMNIQSWFHLGLTNEASAARYSQVSWLVLKLPTFHILLWPNL